MALYMLQASYTSQAWAAMAKKPDDRQQAFRTLCEQANVTFVASYYCFGDYDVIALYDAPDATAAAAVSVACNAGGHIHSAKTTALLTNAEGIEVMKRAGRLKLPTPT